MNNLVLVVATTTLKRTVTDTRPKLSTTLLFSAEGVLMPKDTSSQIQSLTMPAYVSDAQIAATAAYENIRLAAKSAGADMHEETFRLLEKESVGSSKSYTFTCLLTPPDDIDI